MFKFSSKDNASAHELDGRTTSLLLTVVCRADDPATVVFYAVPKIAWQQIGGVGIDWGDGTTQSVDCTLSDADLSECMNHPDRLALAGFTHCYEREGKYSVSIRAPKGWLNLHQLPTQTVSIDSPLPTLTIGETDGSFTLIASDTLPALVPVPVRGRALLRKVCPDLLRNNAQLAYFDNAFAATSLTRIPAGLFACCRSLISLTRTFAESGLESIPEGLFPAARDTTVCEGTFSGCTELTDVSNPFAKGVFPICAEGFLDGADNAVFHWCPRDRRTEMGWKRPCPTFEDPFFSFTWEAPAGALNEPIVTFYPIDLALPGELLVDWGDGAAEYVDWNTADTLTHAYEETGLYAVRLYYTRGEAVRPFHLGQHVRAIHTPLPLFHPRATDARGDFCGWAAGLRELEVIEKPLFTDNPDIVNLEQAFAGCVRLSRVPENFLSGPGENRQLNVDGMFAFCKSLPRLPEDYRSFKRNTALDCFAPKQ
ncbi:MAG: hypothetical protein ACI4SV_03690 [Duodenibacillus sp.]